MVRRVGVGVRWFGNLGYKIRNGVTSLIAQINGSQAMERLVYDIGILYGDAGKRLHRGLRSIGPKAGLASHPLGAFSGNRPLRELILELYLKFRPVKAPLAVRFRNMELAPLLLSAIGHLVGHKSRSGEDEVEGFDLFELLFERLEGVNRKARRRDSQLRTRRHRSFQIIPKQSIDVVDEFHGGSRLPLPGVGVQPGVDRLLPKPPMLPDLLAGDFALLS